MRKRIATNEIGGRSRNPIFMTSQVELQTRQSVTHAIGTPHPACGRHLVCSDSLLDFTRASIARQLRLVKQRRVATRWHIGRLTVDEAQENVPIKMRKFLPLLLCLSLSIFTMARA